MKKIEKVKSWKFLFVFFQQMPLVAFSNADCCELQRIPEEFKNCEPIRRKPRVGSIDCNKHVAIIFVLQNLTKFDKLLNPKD